ncbi:MAG: 50S ribosomal protein L9 [Deltaproteobacteria bacterium]|jgi:large subunit ribosomal protein L9|nr:50S ribosomal protein L9 [Deltaproteobacteria bacterium]MBW2477622.1 50S ribosomal protein L9 [Deltaproteobacteria bacterium]MBW2504218.1 50S ribosomal protein L9 [Deltaproteobacteria bacterium]MBW2519586.1 50S ribosomal protein L9 [Deltaproteobacteria bacterium]
MEIILTENVKGLGNIGEVVNVKPGFARNFLIPKGMAVVASQQNMKELEHHKRQLTRKAEKLSQEAADIKARIEAVECTFAHKASEEGKLFGSVTTMEIAEGLAAKGIEVDRRKILLESPIKSLGVHDVEIKLNAGVNATIKVHVVDINALSDEQNTEKSTLSDLPSEEA